MADSLQRWALIPNRYKWNTKKAPHIAYACVGIFSTVFSLVSLFVKERLYIGEASVASIAGLILGPHCLNWFDPISWGNTDYITLEICRIVLCIQIVAVAVELPRKYMKNHWLSVAIFLLPVMTCGWLVVGLFIWALIPHFNYADALLVSACVTATDPVLAAAVVGKGKFAERVPGHLRNLLTAESGCNDGMAFPFIFLSLNLVVHSGHAREIVKNWFLLTILWECFFGILLGVVIGYTLRHAVAFAEKKDLIDRESFLAIFVFLAFNSAGIGSMLGVDDLLVSFAAGTAFGWDGSFARKTEESHVSTVIDLLLNLAFFVYFGAIVPWSDFNNSDIGLNCWRLVVLAFVIIFLRRMPAVIALKPFTPDVKTWREAFFCGHFGPIGVGAIFAAILARKDLETTYTHEKDPLTKLPSKDFPHYQLIAVIWPVVCFIVITSIIVHGSSVAVLTLGKRLNRMAITMTFTTTNTQEQGPSWMARLQKLDPASTSFSLHRVDTAVATPPEEEGDESQKGNTIETSGIKVRPAGGAKRRKHKKKRRGSPGSKIKKTLSKVHSRDELKEDKSERHRPPTEFLQLGRTSSGVKYGVSEETDSPNTGATSTKEEYNDTESSPSWTEKNETNGEEVSPNDTTKSEDTAKEAGRVAFNAYQEGNNIIIERDNGEEVETIPIADDNQKSDTSKSENSKKPLASPSQSSTPMRRSLRSLRSLGDNVSVHSYDSLRRQLSSYSPFPQHEDEDDSESINSDETDNEIQSVTKKITRTMSAPFRRRAFYKKSDPSHHKVYAHQVDDFLVIENEDGEVIRRYKVNKHLNPEKGRPRSSSIMGKALMMVGLKKDIPEDNLPPEKNSTASLNDDLEQNKRYDILIPESGDPKSLLSNPKIESKIETKLTNLLNAPAKKGGLNISRRSSKHIAKEAVEDESKKQAAQNVSDDSASNDILKESEVERSRRLAALGKLPEGERNDEDEEDE
ncbi:uncharacterized protein PRCAT00002724001 [Priceomyces carsonii]|uniref:uncharacterized protein n=1 Tax=Priceomyces carsonii TaxID=28549 RepID=UPI002EDB7100|nr:unnamed protein product [Priceomyces carsonii]